MWQQLTSILSTVTLFCILLATGEALAAVDRQDRPHLDRHPDALPAAVHLHYDNPYDEDRILKAIKLALKGRHSKAQAIKSELKDPAAQTLLDWLWITGRKGTDSVPFIQRFIADHPNWPDMDMIRMRAERLMHEQETPLPRGYFRENPPVTPVGKYLHGLALEKSDPERARELIRASYREHERGTDFSTRVIETFPEWITGEDKFARLSKLILLHETTQARRDAVRMGDSFPKVARAAHKLLTQARDAEAAKLALPLRYRYQPALQYALMRYYLRKARRQAIRHRAKFVRKAAEAMLVATRGHKELPEAERWWKERRTMIHTALSSGTPAFDNAMAYRLAANHGLVRGIFLTDAEWLAGWIAMRWLEDMSLAERHFRTSLKTAVRTRDKSRAHYWLARTLAKRGKSGEALKQDRLAAGYGFTFYGLLGAGEAGGFANGHPLPPSGYGPVRAVMHMRTSGRLRALELLNKAGARREATQFAMQFARDARTRDELAVIMQAVENVADLSMAMKVARRGAWFGHHVGLPAYPDDPLPDYEHLSVVGPERALVLGIARQESEFDPEARSPVGARGFMQIMPATGRWLCKIHGLRCRTRQLITKPALNVQLGSAFLHRLLEEWDGSYIMVAAGYNAGPSRVVKWNRIVGDPRKGEIHPVDWIELIPFNETRNYVKRVMRNVQIYRRILDPKRELSMQDDLDRGRFHPLNNAQNGICGSRASHENCVAKN